MKFFQRLKEIIHGFFPRINELAATAVKVVDYIRRAAESQAAYVITASIPGDADDKVRKALIDCLPKIAKRLNGQLGQFTDTADPNEIFHRLIAYIRKQPHYAKAGDYVTLASMIYQVLTGDKADHKEAVEETQKTYEILKEKKEVL